MADLGFDTILRWAMAALGAAVVSLALAQPHAVSFRPPDNRLAINAPPREVPRLQEPAAAMYQTAHTINVEHRGKPGAGVRSLRRLGGGRQGSMPVASGGIPYRPVGDARSVPRPRGNATYLRAGSIRDAITRYNEERDTSRPAVRQPAPSTRLPDPSIYRN